MARGYCKDIDQLSGLIQAGIAYPGFSLIDVLQVCVSFNHENTYQFYNDRVYQLDSSDYQADDLHQALELAMEWEDGIPTGILYWKEGRSYADELAPLQSGPLIDREFDPEKSGKPFHRPDGNPQKA